MTSTHTREDAAIVTIPPGKALVQTVDFFTPIVNDPYAFGQIAVANALSDVYAMGGEPWSAMNIVCFPMNSQPKEILSAILHGGADKLHEAHTVLAGGHSVQDREIKFGLAVTGIIDPTSFASNAGLTVGATLVLTKPLGTGILATAIKAEWEGHPGFEASLTAWASKLNAVGSKVIHRFGLKAATDITGFGLGGHALEMAEASQLDIHLYASQVPLLPHAYELASMGLVPVGSHANRSFSAPRTRVDAGVDPILVDCIFDAQTSGGLLLALPPAVAADAIAMLRDAGEEAHIIGEVTPHTGLEYLIIHP